MEKYSQTNDLLLKQLQDEEHNLMRSLGGLMSQMEKTAEDEEKMTNIDHRLVQVRNKIQDMMQSNGKMAENLEED